MVYEKFSMRNDNYCYDVRNGTDTRIEALCAGEGSAEVEFPRHLLAALDEFIEGKPFRLPA